MRSFITFIFLIVTIVSCNFEYKRSYVNGTLAKENLQILKNTPSKQSFVIKPESEITLLGDISMFKASSSLIDGPYASKINYISLDSKKGLLGNIKKIESYKNKIYIFDKKGKALYIYNNKGESQKKIHSIGKGPGEFLMMYDFSLDKKNKQIIILVDQKIQYYNLNGHLIKERKLKNYCTGIACDKNGRLYCYSIPGQNRGQSMQNWSVFSLENDSIKTAGLPFYSFEYHYEDIGYNYPIFKNYKGDILSLKKWNDSIYHINSDSTYKIHAYIKLAKNHSRYEKIKNFSGSKEEAASIIDNSYRIANFWETSNSILGSYILPKKGACNFLIDKKNNTQYHIKNIQATCSYLSDENNVIISSLLNQPKGLSDDDRFIGFIWPFQLKGLHNKYKAGQVDFKNKTLKTFFENYNKDSNPLVVLYKISFKENCQIK